MEGGGCWRGWTFSVVCIAVGGMEFQWYFKLLKLFMVSSERLFHLMMTMVMLMMMTMVT